MKIVDNENEKTTNKQTKGGKQESENDEMKRRQNFIYNIPSHDYHLKNKNNIFLIRMSNNKGVTEFQRRFLGDVKWSPKHFLFSESLYGFLKIISRKINVIIMYSLMNFGFGLRIREICHS